MTDSPARRAALCAAVIFFSVAFLACVPPLGGKLGGAGGGAGGGLNMNFFIMLGAMFLIMFFLVFLPQRREQKRKDQMLRDLKKGDRVVTAGGMFGTVIGVSEKVVVLRIGENLKAEFTRDSVKGVVSTETQETGKDGEKEKE